MGNEKQDKTASKNTRRKAYSKVKYALKKGDITRPDKCEKCGTDPGTAKDGRSLLHAHHEDHSKPLSVEWLCAKCHRKVTRLPLGIRNGNASLTPGLVQAARLLVDEGFFITDIADFYGVSHSGVWLALNGYTRWLEVPAKHEQENQDEM